MLVTSSPALPIHVHLVRGKRALGFAGVQNNFNHAVGHFSDISSILGQRIFEVGEITFFVMTAHVGPDGIEVVGKATLERLPDGKKQLRFELEAARAEDQASCSTSSYPRIIPCR